MIGAIIGDIVGSRFERINHKSKKFNMFDKKCKPTDDSIMLSDIFVYHKTTNLRQIILPIYY